MTQRAFAKIAAGLREALAVVRGKADLERPFASVPFADALVVGPINGLGAFDPEGTALVLSLTDGRDDTVRFRISHGEAHSLVAQLQGALRRD